jgi:hypothetical protein
MIFFFCIPVMRHQRKVVCVHYVTSKPIRLVASTRSSGSTFTGSYVQVCSCATESIVDYRLTYTVTFQYIGTFVGISNNELISDFKNGSGEVYLSFFGPC